MEKYHIGQEILKEVKAKFPSVAAFARELCKSSSATYEIFGKTSLDTDLLLKVSKLLDFTEEKGKDIADPWYTGDFDTTYRDVKKGCEALLNDCLLRF